MFCPAIPLELDVGETYRSANRIGLNDPRTVEKIIKAFVEQIPYDELSTYYDASNVGHGFILSSATFSDLSRHSLVRRRKVSADWSQHIFAVIDDDE